MISFGSFIKDYNNNVRNYNNLDNLKYIQSKYILNANNNDNNSISQNQSNIEAKNNYINDTNECIESFFDSLIDLFSYKYKNSKDMYETFSSINDNNKDEIFSSFIDYHYIYVNENDKTICIYNPSLDENINITLIINKNGKYAYFDYQKSSYQKIKKLWDYKRLKYGAQEKYTKKELMNITTKYNIQNVKSKLKKQEIYDILYDNLFGFR